MPVPRDEESSKTRDDEFSPLAAIVLIPVFIALGGFALFLVWAALGFGWQVGKAGVKYVFTSITAPKTETLEDVIKRLKLNKQTIQRINQSWNHLVQQHSLDSNWESLSPLVVELALDEPGSLNVLNEILIDATMSPTRALPSFIENTPRNRARMFRNVLRGSALGRFRGDLKLCAGRPDQAMCERTTATRVLFRAEEFTDRCIRRALPAD